MMYLIITTTVIILTVLWPALKPKRNWLPFLRKHFKDYIIIETSSPFIVWADLDDNRDAFKEAMRLGKEIPGKFKVINIGDDND